MNKTLSRHASGALDYLIHGPDLARVYKELDKSQWLPRETIVREQWDRIQHILQHACVKVPYYREVLEKAGLSPQDIRNPGDFLRVPILTKDSLRANLERMVDPDADRVQLRKGGTGGSTGEPTPYYQGSLYSKYAGAATFRNMHWTGWDFGDRIVQLWGSPFDVSVGQSLRGRINRVARNTRVVPAFDMGKPAMKDYLREIADFRPELIIGYVDALYLLACYILELGPATFKSKPRAVISAAGTLYDYQRSAIETAFGCQVFNRYGGREMGDIAHECEVGQGLHINAETVYVEVIRDGGLCPPGVEGELILTSLTNFEMPMIRYAVGDRGVLADPSFICACGRGLPLLESVTGRVQDVIVTPSGRYISGAFFPHLFKEIPNVRQFQVVQESADTLAIKVAPAVPELALDLQFLEAKISQYVGADVKVITQVVDVIQPGPSGKFRPVISQVPIDIPGYRSLAD